MKIKTLSNRRDEKKFPSIRKKYYVIKFILIFHVFFNFGFMSQFFSGLGFNFRVKWFMGLCPYFYFIRVKRMWVKHNMGLCPCTLKKASSIKEWLSCVRLFSYWRVISYDFLVIKIKTNQLLCDFISRSEVQILNSISE